MSNQTENIAETAAAAYIPGILNGVTATVGGRQWEITDDPEHPLVVKIQCPTPKELTMLLQFNADYDDGHACMNSLQISGGNSSVTLRVYADYNHRQFVGQALGTYLREVRD